MKAARIKSEPPSTLVNLLPGTCSAAQISDQFSLAYSLALVLIRHGEGSARPGANFLVTKRLSGGSDFSFFQGRHPRRQQIARASCRERVCRSESIQGVGRYLKKKWIEDGIPCKYHRSTTNYKQK